jgi:hypothetical protein
MLTAFIGLPGNPSGSKSVIGEKVIAFLVLKTFWLNTCSQKKEMFNIVNT